MMKRFLLLAFLAACGKPNDVQTLHHEAIVTAKYYQRELGELDRRLQGIYKRGTTIPGNLPGIDVATERLREARDGISQLRGIVGDGTGKSAVEKEADLAAKDRNVEKLTKLVADTEKTLLEGTTIIRADLSSVEGWIALYDQGLNRTGAGGGSGEGQQQPPVAPAQPPTPAPGNNTTPPSENAQGQIPGGSPQPARPAGGAGSAAH